jgi:zinc transport system permease protein
MASILSYGFLQRALVAGLFVAVVCAILGVFLILRRDAMIGHGLSHVTFAGVALGFFLRLMPLPVALVTGIVAALGIMKLRDVTGVYADTAMAIVSSVGLAVGIILATLARSFSASLLNYLFGDILAIEPVEVGLTIGLAVIVVVLVVRNYRAMMYTTFDRESACVAGLRVRRIDALLTILTSVTIVLGMKVVGILLVSALVVLPAAAGLQLASSFKAAILLSVGTAILSVLAGLTAAVLLDLPPSGTIVLTGFVLFVGSFLWRKRRGL